VRRCDADCVTYADIHDASKLGDADKHCDGNGNNNGNGDGKSESGYRLNICNQPCLRRRRRFDRNIPA
jgi:hypothetical protein